MIVQMLEGRIDDGMVSGGQLTTTTDIENFPGFPEGIGGGELVDRMKAQCVRFGTKVLPETVSSVDFTKHREFIMHSTSGKTYKAEAVIIATGATAKKIPFKGSEEYWNKGISACAVCDGALPLFRNKPLVVIGGGDTAMEEAQFLTKYGSVVHICVRRDVLRASKIMQDRAKKNPKIVFHWNTELIEAHGEKNRLQKVTIKNAVTGAVEVLDANGLFYAIGHKPASDFLGGVIHMDADGYVITHPGTVATNIHGVFAAGDVQDKRWRQAITAAGTGCMAALSVEHFLQQDAATTAVQKPGVEVH